MRIFNVCTRKVYYIESGQRKIKWYKAGILKISDAGKMYLQLFHQPQTEFFVFDRDKPSAEIQSENKEEKMREKNIHCDKCGNDWTKAELENGKCPDCGNSDNLCEY